MVILRFRTSRQVFRVLFVKLRIPLAHAKPSTTSPSTIPLNVDIVAVAIIVLITAILICCLAEEGDKQMMLIQE